MLQLLEIRSGSLQVAARMEVVKVKPGRRLIFSKCSLRAPSTIRRLAPRLAPHRPLPDFHRNLVPRIPSCRTATEPLTYTNFIIPISALYSTDQIKLT